jgi:uncharacterized membrane protein YdbT with pleckstrin-like domain
MNNSNTEIQVKPSPIFAFIKALPFTLLAACFLYLSNRFFPPAIWPSLLAMLMAIYRYFYIRKAKYLVTEQYIRISRGIFFKTIETVELFRVKDYVITEPFFLQLFRLMDLHLKTTDPEAPEIWLRGIPQSDIIDIIRERVLETRQHNRIFEIN